MDVYSIRYCVIYFFSVNLYTIECYVKYVFCGRVYDWMLFNARFFGCVYDWMFCGENPMGFDTIATYHQCKSKTVNAKMPKHYP